VAYDDWWSLDNLRLDLYYGPPDREGPCLMVYTPLPPRRTRHQRVAHGLTGPDPPWVVRVKEPMAPADDRVSRYAREDIA
jgi:hypothetical protein